MEVIHLSKPLEALTANTLNKAHTTHTHTQQAGQLLYFLICFSFFPEEKKTSILYFFPERKKTLGKKDLGMFLSKFALIINYWA